MPDAGNGADDGGFRCRGKLCGCCGKVGGKTGILHSDFDRNRTFLGGIHAGKLSGTVSEQIAQTVVKKHCGKNDCSGLEKLRTLRRNHTANDAGEP